MSNTPGLVIPVRFDHTKAVSGLRAIEAAGKQAGDKTAAGMDHASQATKGLGSEMAGLMKFQMGLSFIKNLATGISESFKQTAADVAQSAKEFQALRKTMQELATLKGQANSTKFTIAEAQKAQAAGLTPQESRDFQAEFMNYAGAQIGGPNGKLTDAQGEEFGNRVASLMKSSGLTPAIGAETAGMLLENAKGPQDVDTLMKQLTMGFNALEKGRVKLERALPQMAGIMGHGVEFTEAAQMLSIAAPAAPGQEGVAVENALKAIEEMKTKGSGEEFGVKRGMSQFDSVKAFAENLNQRKQAMLAGGATEDQARDDLVALLAEKGIAADVRERKGLVAGFARQGVEMGGFERYGDIVKNTPEDFEASRKERYAASDQGRQDAVDAAAAVAQAKMGARGDLLTRFRQIAETEAKEGGKFDAPSMQDRLSGQWSKVGAASEHDQIVNRQALASARARLGETGGGVGDNLASLDVVATNKILVGLLDRLVKVNEQQLAKALEPDPQPMPLVSQPQPAGRL